MNEYLCRNFVADQILSDMSMTRVRRRLGTAVALRNAPSNNLPSLGKNKADTASLRNSLLLDEGSSNYKHWLQKYVIYFTIIVTIVGDIELFSL